MCCKDRNKDRRTPVAGLMDLLSYYIALYEIMTNMPPSIDFTTKLVSEDTMIVITGLHCHKQSSHNYKAIS